MNNTNRNEVMWIVSIVSLGMLSQLWLQLETAAYLALFPTMAATKLSKYSMTGMLKAFLPILGISCLALFIEQLFGSHPFIVWTISLFVFDFARRWADTPTKLGQIYIPLLNWFLVIVFAQHTPIPMTDWVRDMGISMVTTIIVVQFVMLFMTPVKAKTPPPSPAKQVSYQQRVIYVAMLGIGLAFLMIVDLVSATFCMMPVIIAAAQHEKSMYQAVVKTCLQAHVGGCAFVLLLMSLLVSQHSHIFIYAFAIVLLVTMIAVWISRNTGSVRALHTEAMLGAMLPLQLYVSRTDLGLQDIYFRGQLMLIVLILLVFCQGVIYGKSQNLLDYRS